MTVNTTKKKSKSTPLIIFLLIIFLLIVAACLVFIKSILLSDSNFNKNRSNNSYKSITKKINTPDNDETVKSKNFSNNLKTITEPSPVVPEPTTDKPVIIEKAVKESILKNNNWILSQEPLLFTIQVMAAKDKEALDRFLKLDLPNKDQIAYYKTNTKKDVWYKFISGRYKTLKETKQAIDNLPEKIKNLGPWPRQFKSIQNEINGSILKK